MLAHSYNSNSWEVEAKWLEVQSYPWLCSQVWGQHKLYDTLLRVKNLRNLYLLLKQEQKVLVQKFNIFSGLPTFSSIFINVYGGMICMLGVMPKKAREGDWFPGAGVNRQVSTLTWVLGTNLWSSERTRALNHWTSFFCCCCLFNQIYTFVFSLKFYPLQIFILH